MSCQLTVCQRGVDVPADFACESVQIAKLTCQGSAHRQTAQNPLDSTPVRPGTGVCGLSLPATIYDRLY